MTDDSNFDDPSHNDHGDNSDAPKLTTEVNIRRRRQRPSSSPSEAHSGSAPRHVRSQSNDTPVRIRTRTKPTDDVKLPKPTRIPNQPSQSDEENGGTPPPAPAPSAAPSAPTKPPAKPKATRKRKNRKPNLPAELKGKGGYGDPPVKYQFKPKQSGNPNGRPKKKSKSEPSAMDRFRRIAMEPMPMAEHGKTMEVPKIEATLRRCFHDAMAGKVSSLKALPLLWDLTKKLDAQPKGIEFTAQELELLTSVFGESEFQDLLDDGSDNGDERNGSPDEGGTPGDNDDQGGQ